MKAKYISPVCDIMETDIMCSVLAGSDPKVVTQQIVSEKELNGFDYDITTGTGGGWSSLAKNRFIQDEEDW